MAVEKIRIEGTLAHALILAGVAICLLLSAFCAKWCFANAVSTRTAEREVAELAISLGPDDPQTHFAAAVIHEKTFDARDLSRSLAEYERVAVLSPNNYLAWLELANARARNGDLAAAESAYARSLSLAPAYADVQWAYGNSLIRQDRIDEGFALMRASALAKPDLMPTALSTALMVSDGDLTRVSALLGTSPAVSMAIAKYAANKNDLDQAVASLELIPVDDLRTVYRDDVRELAARIAAAKRFRLAARVTTQISDDGHTGPEVGAITNGGFETLDLDNKNIFDWQITAGAGQQIGLNSEQRTGGNYSLYMIFNTMLTAEFRSVSQTVTVVPGASYSFVGNSRAELKGLVAWEIADAADGKILARTPPIGSSVDWVRFQADITVPATSDGIIIRLVRDGCASSVCPINGKVWLDDLKLSRQQ